MSAAKHTEYPGGKRILMVGTDPSGKGGVASVVSVYRNAGLFERFSIVYLATHVGGSKLDKALAAIGAALRLIGLLASRRIAIVHVHSASRASFVRKSMVLLLARWSGAKTIFHLHGAEFQKYAEQEAGPLLRWWIMRTLEKSAFVIALSQSWATFLNKLAPAANVRVIANPVVYESLPAAATEDGRIIFLGRAEKRKGIFELVEATALLASEFPGIRLAIGGDGDLERIKQHAQSVHAAGLIEILGWVGPELKKQELTRAAVFALPSYDEGLPMAMLEAMSAGKAIVMTPVGGIPEAVQDGVHGLLVEPGNVTALASALGALLRDAGLRERLGAGARERVRERFSTEVVLQQLGALYRELGAHEAARIDSAIGAPHTGPRQHE